MSKLWYRLWHWLCVRLYFEGITVLHPERLPRTGPVLYVGLHRNGAVDGFIYAQAAPRGVFLVSTQLLRSFFARLYFCGIGIARQKEGGDPAQTDAALRQCMQLLANGGELIVFPEGTSALGPRHLPFQSGAARMALAVLDQGTPLRIVPLGIRYERAWAFRSKAEVIVGEPVFTSFPAGLSERRRLRELRQRLTTALELVGANFPSAAAQDEAQSLAYAATLGTSRSYFKSLKALEAGVPEALLGRWRELASAAASGGLWLHQGVPLFPLGPWLLYATLLLILGPLVVAGTLANLPPLWAGWLAARNAADGPNVVALWRILVGVPAFLIWFSIALVALGILVGWPGQLGYALLTFAALKSLYRTRKLAVAVWNGLTHRDLAPRARELHQALLQHLASSGQPQKESIADQSSETATAPPAPES